MSTWTDEKAFRILTACKREMLSDPDTVDEVRINATHMAHEVILKAANKIGLALAISSCGMAVVVFLSLDDRNEWLEHNSPRPLEQH